MKKKFLAVTLALAMASTLFAGGIPAAAEEEQNSENAITVGIAQDFDSLDPHYMTAAGTKEVLFNVFEGLVKPTSDGEIVPAEED